MPRTPKPLPTWEIYIARAKAVHLGTVEAADADAAIEAAAKEFKADPKRLIAVRRAWACAECFDLSTEVVPVVCAKIPLR
jgi:hypothetical protein